MMISDRRSSSRPNGSQWSRMARRTVTGGLPPDRPGHRGRLGSVCLDVMKHFYLTAVLVQSGAQRPVGNEGDDLPASGDEGHNVANCCIPLTPAYPLTSPSKRHASSFQTPAPTPTPTKFDLPFFQGVIRVQPPGTRSVWPHLDNLVRAPPPVEDICH
eukprot:754155-Hanusia_phi.AAC.1